MADPTVYLAGRGSSYRRNGFTKGLACVPGFRNLAAMLRHHRLTTGKTAANRVTVETMYEWLIDAYREN